jgi:hypothetical protein
MYESKKPKLAKSKHCTDDLYVEIEDHKDIPLVAFWTKKLSSYDVILKHFNALTVNVKMIEDNKEFICKSREILHKNQCYDLN